MSTKLNGPKYGYVSQTIQSNTSHLFTQLNDQTVLFQTIQFNISTQFFCVHTVKCKNSSFLTIQFSVIIQFTSIWPIERTLTGATTPSQSEPGSNSNKGALCIPHALPSDCLVLYPGHS